MVKFLILFTTLAGKFKGFIHLIDCIFNKRLISLIPSKSSMEGFFQSSWSVTNYLLKTPFDPFLSVIYSYRVRENWYNFKMLKIDVTKSILTKKFFLHGDSNLNCLHEMLTWYPLSYRVFDRKDLCLICSIKTILKTESKKGPTFKNWPLVKNPHFCPISMKLCEKD